MKQSFLIALMLLLVGCAPNTVIKKEVVTVNKPVPYCPAPPADLPQVNLLVDTLTDADAANPGKVGQYYKHDMYYLRKKNELLELIIEQYRVASGDLDAIKVEIDKIFAEIEAADKELVERLKTE
jgi:PBP1b-binding outer membrane lipoprotein LpoB